ncbi:hypothetical protein [Defluviimonas salinarum]|uniref:DUF2793 domain-containing protein n=1 Tax=Defluviimonas salinarum TaxID=2992147 RepID=A0ABT3J364_9RHOB|nr:hypothetical protein [Defluviimonas salinarum]MCW3782122.1 hypothetical protein [Defluviimonas salinarum]
MVDYNLANQSGAQFRAELNLILAALQSCAYGTTAPATTTAGQLWVDAAGTDPVLRIRDALNADWTPLGTLGPAGFELAGSSAAGRALLAAATVAAQRTALGLGAGATLTLASQAQAQAGTNNATLMTPLRVAEAIAALAAGASDLLAGAMATTVADNAVVLKHCSGGSDTATLSLSKSGNGTIHQLLLGETALTATRTCGLRVALEQARGNGNGTQYAAVLRDGTVLQEWSTTSTSFVARSLDVTLGPGQTLSIRLGATGTTTGQESTQNTGISLIRNVRYLADQRSLIGI